MKFKLINKTRFSTKQLADIASALCESQAGPSFYLICQTPQHDGIAITNIDKPFIIIWVKNLSQFAKVFVHELTHLQQNAKGYTSENFSRFIVTSKRQQKEPQILILKHTGEPQEKAMREKPSSASASSNLKTKKVSNLESSALETASDRKKGSELEREGE